jgi:carbamoyltransferase
LAHAASAYYTAGWDDCLVVVADGMGEVESVTVYAARNGTFEHLGTISARDSIGIMYSLVTLHLGFDFNADEYKIMGLAPYGDPARHRKFFEQAVELGGAGDVRIPLLHVNKTRNEREQYLATRAYLAAHLIRPRDPAADIVDEHRDVAAALQACLDRTMLHICEHYARTTGLRRLAMAGGVALNCTANGKLLASRTFDEIYVQPAAGDDGTALGAALYVAAKAGEINNVRMPVPFLGPEYGTADIDAALARHRHEIIVRRYDQLSALCADVAHLIGDGHVIAWYRGRMEFGPRALGHRSVLADPGRPEMRDRINAMVKMREAFRPFAPAVTLERASEWFSVKPGEALPYMIMTVPVREERRGDLPAVTHVDGSARVQTVSRSDNAVFHQLLLAIGATTGREMVLNTSFNVKGQPIVNTPEEALTTFLGTGIDFLVMENVLVSRTNP